MLEKELFTMCCTMIELFIKLKKDGTITQKEFELHTKIKLQHIKDYNSSNLMDSIVNPIM